MSELKCSPDSCRFRLVRFCDPKKGCFYQEKHPNQIYCDPSQCKNYNGRGCNPEKQCNIPDEVRFGKVAEFEKFWGIKAKNQK